MTFHWSELHGPYGPATHVTNELLRAEEASDPLDCLDIVLRQAVFVCDKGTLNEGAAPFVKLLFDAVRRGSGSARAIWPFLRGIFEVMAARATTGDHFGLAPGEGPPLSYVGAQSAHERLIAQGRERHLSREVDAVVRSESALLANLIRHGASEARAHATAISIVAFADPTTIRAALEYAISREANLRTRASLQLGWAKLGPGGSQRVSKILVDDLDADGLRSGGAAIACIWRSELFADHRDRVLERIVPALCYVDPRSSHDVFDYAWHRELVCGEAARAVWASDIPYGLKVDLLGRALEIRVEETTGGVGEVSPATSAAWFLMRLGLSRHYHRSSILGPEDLDDAEREILRRLATHRSWLGWGGDLPERFGITNFDAAVGRLLREQPDALSPLQEGTWAGRFARWSRWKWLRSAIDETLFGSHAREAGVDIACEVVSQLPLDQLVLVAGTAAAEAELPYDGILLRLLARVSGRHDEDDARRWMSAAQRISIEEPARRAAYQLAIAAAFGLDADYRDAIARAHSARVSEALRLASEQAFRARVTDS